MMLSGSHLAAREEHVLDHTLTERCILYLIFQLNHSLFRPLQQLLPFQILRQLMISVINLQDCILQLFVRKVEILN
jgi:hypothetical protein